MTDSTMKDGERQVLSVEYDVAKEVDYFQLVPVPLPARDAASREVGG